MSASLDPNKNTVVFWCQDSLTRQSILTQCSLEPGNGEAILGWSFD